MAKLILSYVAAKNVVETGTPEEIIRISNMLTPMGFGTQVDAAREAIAVKKTVNAKSLVASFLAHCKVSNVGAMQVTLQKFRNAELQVGLIRHLGGVESRDKFLSAAQESVTSAMKVKATSKKRRHAA